MCLLNMTPRIGTMKKYQNEFSWRFLRLPNSFRSENSDFLSAMVSVIKPNFSRSKHVNFDASLFRFLWGLLGISFKGISINLSAWSSRWFPSKQATEKSIVWEFIIDFAISFPIRNEFLVIYEPLFSYVGRYKTITYINICNISVI